MRYSPDGSKFITVSSDKKGIIYDGKSGEKIGELFSEGAHSGSIYAVSWSPDGKQVNKFLALARLSIYLILNYLPLKILIPLAFLGIRYLHFWLLGIP